MAPTGKEVPVLPFELSSKDTPELVGLSGDSKGPQKLVDNYERSIPNT